MRHRRENTGGAALFRRQQSAAAGSVARVLRCYVVYLGASIPAAQQSPGCSLHALKKLLALAGGVTSSQKPGLSSLGDRVRWAANAGVVRSYHCRIWLLSLVL